MKVEFHVEPADRSVGIMTEGFSAWVLDEDPISRDFIAKKLTSVWCDLVDYGATFETAKFQWFSNETGDKVERPVFAEIVERLLHTYVLVWYALHECDTDPG